MYIINTVTKIEQTKINTAILVMLCIVVTCILLALDKNINNIVSSLCMREQKEDTCQYLSPCHYLDNACKTPENVISWGISI